MTVFVASGDNGAFNCWRNDPSDHRETAVFHGPYRSAVITVWIEGWILCG